eukprot:m.144093 g.144093  ORF g.144093 m.144093 type:complete len:550 (+) comp16035_c1_seq1:1272-2921(+)
MHPQIASPESPYFCSLLCQKKGEQAQMLDRKLCGIMVGHVSADVLMELRHAIVTLVALSRATLEQMQAFWKLKAHCHVLSVSTEGVLQMQRFFLPKVLEIEGIDQHLATVAQRASAFVTCQHEGCIFGQLSSEASILCHILCILRFNSFSVPAPSDEEESEEGQHPHVIADEGALQRRLQGQQQSSVATEGLEHRMMARALFLNMSLFNHSCTPNAAQSFHGRMARVVASDTVPSDASLLISYGPLVCRHPLRIRRALTEERFGFVCFCTGCVAEGRMSSSASNLSDQKEQDPTASEPPSSLPSASGKGEHKRPETADDSGIKTPSRIPQLQRHLAFACRAHGTPFGWPSLAECSNLIELFKVEAVTVQDLSVSLKNSSNSPSSIWEQHGPLSSGSTKLSCGCLVQNELGIIHEAMLAATSTRSTPSLLHTARALTVHLTPATLILAEHLDQLAKRCIDTEQNFASALSLCYRSVQICEKAYGPICMELVNECVKLADIYFAAINRQQLPPLDDVTGFLNAMSKRLLTLVPWNTDLHRVLHVLTSLSPS